MLKVALQRGVRFGYVGIDGGYGKEPAFLRGVDRLSCRFVADVHCDQTIYLQDPEPKVPAWKGIGKQPKHLKAQCDAVRVDQWAAGQPEEAWQRITSPYVNIPVACKIQFRRQKWHHLAKNLKYNP